MFIADVSLSHPDLALAHTIQAVPDAAISLEYQAITGPDTYHLFFKVETDDFDAFEAAVDADPTVADSTLTLDGGSFRVYRMRLVAVEYLVLPKAAEYGMRVLHATSGDNGWIGKLEVADPDRLRAFVEFCQSKGVGATIKRIYGLRNEAGDRTQDLTPAQREALVVATEAGYFNEPRDASLQDVADLLGVSASAAGGRLRRGTSKLVRRMLIDEESK